MQLSVTDRIRLAYSQVELWFGLLFSLVGFGTLTQANWENFYFWFDSVTTVPGRIVTTYPTNVSDGDRPVRGYTYRYPAVGLEWAGTSFSSDSTLLPGQRADVEYCVAHPAVSRLKGTDSAPMGTTGLQVGLTLGGAGLVMSWRSTQRVHRLLILLDDAVTTQSVYERTSTEPGQDDEKHYTLHYVYQVAHQRYTLRVDSPSATPSRKQELVVFQGANPANAVLATALPAFVQVKLALPRV